MKYDPRWLEQCRDSFGEPPRSFGWWNRLTYLRVPRPSWCHSEEPLGKFFSRKNALLQDGIVVWGYMIQANSILLHPGPYAAYSAPGEVVYCLDSTQAVEPFALQEVARNIGALKGTKPEDQDLAGIADYLTDERTRVFGLRVPRSLSPELKCAISTLYFVRKHIPGRFLRTPLFPIILAPGKPRIVMLLPERYWPKELVDWWVE
jgi:hypothetical protein